MYLQHQLLELSPLFFADAFELVSNLTLSFCIQFVTVQDEVEVVGHLDQNHMVSLDWFELGVATLLW